MKKVSLSVFGGGDAHGTLDRRAERAGGIALLGRGAGRGRGTRGAALAGPLRSGTGSAG